MSAEKSVAASETIAITDNVSVTKRSYYSIGWLVTADIMKTHAEEIGGGDTRPDVAAYAEMRSCVLSAVTASAAFLESHINELFDDACFHEPTQADGLDYDASSWTPRLVESRRSDCLLKRTDRRFLVSTAILVGQSLLWRFSSEMLSGHVLFLSISSRDLPVPIAVVSVRRLHQRVGFR